MVFLSYCRTSKQTNRAASPSGPLQNKQTPFSRFLLQTSPSLSLLHNCFFLSLLSPVLHPVASFFSSSSYSFGSRLDLVSVHGAGLTSLHAAGVAIRTKPDLLPVTCGRCKLEKNLVTLTRSLVETARLCVHSLADANHRALLQKRGKQCNLNPFNIPTSTSLPQAPLGGIKPI